MRHLVIFLIVFGGFVVLTANAQYMGNISNIQPEGSFPLEHRTGSIQPLDYPFELKSQQYANFPAEDLSILFLDVFEDSRCPIDVTCVWEGRVGLRFDISTGHGVEMTMDTFGNNITNVFDKYQIQLIDVKPYSSSRNTINIEDYVAILKVTKDNSISDSGNLGTKIPSPLKQFRSGIPIEQIQCRDGLELVIKASNSSPACLRPQSIVVLLIRGWGMQGNELVFDMSAGQRESSVLVKEIFSDHISGLNFMEYPVARDEGFPILLHVGETASNGCTVEMTLLRINDKTATFLKKEYPDRPCPICLSEDTVIDTPNGPVNVMKLKEGMDIFTQDAHGNKYIGTILATGKTTVSPDHKMVHIVLTDDRDLYGSPNHPTTEGTVLGELQAGDNLDGSTIKFAETIQYNGTYTYDILPSGSTGYYWANKILIKSTLD